MVLYIFESVLVHHYHSQQVNENHRVQTNTPTLLLPLLESRPKSQQQSFSYVSILSKPLEIQYSSSNEKDFYLHSTLLTIIHFLNFFIIFHFVIKQLLT